MNIRPTNNQGGVRGLADQALEQFEGYGKFLNERGRPVDAALTAAGAPTGAAGIGDDGLKAAKKAAFDDIHAPEEFGILGKTLAKFGALVDGVSGVGELAQTFAAERERTDLPSRLNVATLGKSVEVTARISATSVVGVEIFGAVAAATGLTVLPVVAGAAAGVAAGYAVGKLAEGGRSLYRNLEQRLAS